MSDAGARVDLILSTLNAADMGSLDSIATKLSQVRRELEALDQPALAESAAAAVAALERGDVAEFQRTRAYLQSKVGHLR